MNSIHAFRGRLFHRAFVGGGVLVASVWGCSAADGPSVDSGHTAWIMGSCALVLFMMIPGLALFYAGLVRNRNVLSIFMARPPSTASN
jgi:Amt family ammonium transporter